MQLSDQEKMRYAQHLKLKDFGIEAQLKLKNATILCVGAGGLGSPMLLYLAAAGVGTLGIMDDDRIAVDNLQRQILYQTNHINKHKIDIAEKKLLALNNDIQIIKHATRLNNTNINEHISQYDFIVDCSDNFTTKYLINDTCYKLNKPYVYASVLNYEGQCSVFLGKKTPCLRCLFPNYTNSTNCQTNGILGVLPGLLGIIQATETIKWITGIGKLLTSTLLTVDALDMQFKHFYYEKNAECQLCFS